MAVIVVGNERSLSAMNRRLFRAGASAAEIDKLHKVIRTENPEVDFARLQPGLVLRLPRSPLLKAHDSLSFDDTISEAVGATRDQLRADLGALVGDARAALREEDANRRTLTKLLGSRQVTVAVSDDESVAEALKAAQEGLAEDAAADERLGAVIKQAVSEWGDELEALDRLHP